MRAVDLLLHILKCVMKIKDRIVHYLCNEVIWIIYDYENI